MKFSARFGVTIPNSELLKGFKTYQRWNVFYLFEPLITDVTSLTKLKRLLSLACHLQMKTFPRGTNVLLSCAQFYAVQNSFSDETIVFRQKRSILCR